MKTKDTHCESLFTKKVVTYGVDADGNIVSKTTAYVPRFDTCEANVLITLYAAMGTAAGAFSMFMVIRLLCSLCCK